jgi:DNA-binding MarR family transcriptional regulator
MKLEDEIVQKKFDSDYHKLAVNILYTSHWLTNLYSDALKPHNLTIQQFNILRILRGQHPKVVNLKLIKERMLDKMSDVSRLVERLREKGLVERKICPTDRRNIDICITNEGLNLLKELDKDIEKFNLFLSNLSMDEIQSLNDTLDKLRG